MAAYDSLKSLVQQAIRTNGNNEITGQVLQNVLMAMIDELGGENGYAGVATPSTNPGAPDGKVFYFATEAGTYTHFDGATLAKGIHLLVFNGVTWSHQTLYTIDSEVTSGSNNLIISGAVYAKIVNAINALNATVSKSAGADGLSLSLTEVNGKVTDINGSIDPQTYDAYGAASAAQNAAATDATNKVNAAKTQILGDAASDYNTLGKLEDKIQAEASRAAVAESALNTAKANKATTLAGYGINDAYTKTEVNGLVSTPHQNYVTVPTYASLPATGSEDTIYRVSNYNGSTSQVDASVYSEYAWNGSGYTFLRVDSQIGEVFDITVYNSNTKYANLAAALGTNGANVPQSLRKGGMSVKFVQSSDNKYVQYRLMSDTFNVTVANWQGVDNEPVGGSTNLTESKGVFDKIDIYGLSPFELFGFLYNTNINYATYFKWESGYYNTSFAPVTNPDLLRIIIPIHKDKTFYYKKFWAYYSGIKYNDGTSVRLSNTETGKVNGSFTPTKDGELYITVAKEDVGNATVVFTTSKNLYFDAWTQEYFWANKFREPLMFNESKTNQDYSDFDSVDLCTITTFNDVTGISHCPSASGGTLICTTSKHFNNKSGALQIYITINSDFYVRFYWGTAWTGWKELPNKDYIDRKIGEIVADNTIEGIKLSTSVTGTIQNNINLTSVLQSTANTYWNRSQEKKTDSGNIYSSLEPFRIVKGVTIYYRNLKGYYCSIVYDNGTVVFLADSDITVSDEIIPADDGTMYVSYITSAENTVLITSSEYVYNDIYNNVSDGQDINKTYLRTFIPSTNKIPCSTIKQWRNGYIRYNNGKHNVDSSDYYKVTPFLRIENCKKFGVSTGIYSFGFYDINKNYIQTTALNAEKHDYVEYDVPANAVFVRFTAVSSQLEKQYFTLGDGIHCPMECVKVEKTRTWGVDFTTLRAASEYATQYSGVRIYVGVGTYDLSQEYSTEITNDHDHSAIYWYGINLKNDVYWYFSSGAKVNAYYQGDNYVETRKHFCPFNATGGFTLENLWIEAGNTRYCVHDDYSGVTNGTQHHKFLNCHMEYLTTEGTNLMAIGGGFAEFIDVEIVGCWFKTAFAETCGYTTRIVSYHNSGTYTNGKSCVNVRNCYFSGWGTYATTAYGPSEQVSLSMISGCSLGGEPYKRYETSDKTTPMNVDLIAFNNEIRTH